MSREMPPGISIKGNRLLMRIKRPGKGWGWESTGLTPENITAAAKLRAKTQSIIDSGSPVDEYGRTTVSAYAERWLQDRRDRGLKAVNDYERWLRKHMLDHRFETDRVFGSLFMDEVRPLHCRAVIKGARKKDLAPKSILTINSLGSSMFRDAVADEIYSASPWVVPTKDLPKKRDKDPQWRATAKFERQEVARIMWAPDALVPWDRRVFYALMYLGALRVGEASARRWKDRMEFSGHRALHVHSSFSTERGTEGETKTESVRMMPEHPVLTTLLNEWKLSGWEQFFGRAPRENDLIVPSRMGVFRRKNHSLHKLHEDPGRLNIRTRRQHDLRRSFIGHAVDDGATRDRLKPGTHGLGHTVLEQYDTPDWVACVEHVLRLKVQPLAAEEALPVAVGMVTMVTNSPVIAAIDRQRREAGSDKSATYKGLAMINNPGGPVFNSRRLHHLNASQTHLRAVSAPSDHGVTTAARALLEACGGDVAVAIAALRQEGGAA